MVTLILNIPDDLFRELEQQSNALNLTVDEIAQDVLRRHLRRLQSRSSRVKLVPLAEARGIRSDEDVFRRLKPRSR